MPSRPLNHRQLDVLRWISDGLPADRWSDSSYKTTCYALARRGLADVDRRRETWSATITDAGVHYLKHGRFPGSLPDDLRERLRDAGPRPFGVVSAAEWASAIMHALDQEGVESVKLSTADYKFNSDQVRNAAHRSPWRPEGKRLALSWEGQGSDRQHVAYYESDLALGARREVVPVPARVVQLHPAAEAYKGNKDRQEVSKASLSRAYRIIHAIAQEAERRGGSLSYSPRAATYHAEFRSSLAASQFTIRLDGHGFNLRIKEASDPGIRSYARSDLSKPRWIWMRNTTFVPTVPCGRSVGGAELEWESSLGRDS